MQPVRVEIYTVLSAYIRTVGQIDKDIQNKVEKNEELHEIYPLKLDKVDTHVW